MSTIGQVYGIDLFNIFHLANGGRKPLSSDLSMVWEIEQPVLIDNSADVFAIPVCNLPVLGDLTHFPAVDIENRLLLGVAN